MSNNLKVILLQKKLLKKKENTNKEKSIKLTSLINSNQEISKEINKLINPKKGQIYVHVNNNYYSFYQFTGKEWHEVT